jgi:hypothetical protein
MPKRRIKAAIRAVILKALRRNPQSEVDARFFTSLRPLRLPTDVPSNSSQRSHSLSDTIIVWRRSIMSQRLSRRDFSMRAASASLGTAGFAAVLAGAEPPTRGDDRDRRSTPADPADAPPAALPLPEDLLLAALIQRYPSEHLTPERLAGIRAGLRRNLDQGDVLRRVPLSNEDAPAVIFRAWRSDD